MYYYKQKSSNSFISTSDKRPDLADTHDELGEEAYLKLQEEKMKKIEDLEEEAKEEHTTSTISVEGFNVEIIDNDTITNIGIISYYIEEYKDEKELIELGEISSTTITDAQYKGLLKLRVEWRKELT